MPDYPEVPADLQKKVQSIIKADTSEFSATINSTDDLLVPLLKFHLLAEQSLERLILAKLSRGDRLLRRGRLGFAQKLNVVDALDILDDRVVSCLRGLNKVRNNLAHNRQRSLTVADIDLLAHPLGGEYTDQKHRAPGNTKHLLVVASGMIFQKLMSAVVLAELVPSLESPHKGA